MKVVPKRNIGGILFKNKVYEAEYTPTIYDPSTFQPIPSTIIVKINGKWKKCDMDDFNDLQILRDKKLEKILE